MEVTEEAFGSICKALFRDVVVKQASFWQWQIYRGQGKRSILNRHGRSMANNIQRALTKEAIRKYEQKSGLEQTVSKRQGNG